MTTEAGYERRPHEAYWTEPWVVETLLRYISFKAPQPLIWEPACGSGNICKVLLAHGHQVIATDLVDHGYDHMQAVQNFLQPSVAQRPASHIITNPPFGRRGDLAGQFIYKGLKHIRGTDYLLALLLRNDYDCAFSRRHLFNSPLFTTKLVLHKRPLWIAGRKRASPRHNYAWYVWRGKSGAAKLSCPAHLLYSTPQ